jgi:transcriptional regulator with XRE-family HTH domain
VEKIARLEKKDHDLIWVREQAFLTQREAAAVCGVSRVTYNRWESGDNVIPARRRGRFYIALGIKAADIPACVSYGPDWYPISFTPKITPYSTDAEVEEVSQRLLELEGVNYKARQAQRDLELEAQFLVDFDSTKPNLETARKVVASQHRKSSSNTAPLSRVLAVGHARVSKSPVIKAIPRPIGVTAYEFEEGLDLV